MTIPRNSTKTLLRVAAAAATCSLGASAQVAFNELYVSHSGSDIKEFIELEGTPGLSLDGYVVCVIEGDYGTTGVEPGKLDRAWDLTGFSIPASGYFVLGEPAVTPAPDFVIDHFGSGQDTLENGTDTFVLVLASSPANAAAIVAAVGTDIDAANAPDDDLVTILPTLGTLVDNVAIVDCGFQFTYPGGTSSPNTDLDRVYDSPTITGPEGVCNNLGNSNAPGGFLPAGVFRGLDAPNPWCPEFLDFNEGLNQNEPRTPGAMNSVCPSASSVVNYCTAGTTTNGCTPSMAAVGTPSLSVGPGGFVVQCNGVEGQKQGIIFYGVTGPLATSWGTSSSFLCVKSPQQRTGTQFTGGNFAVCDGTLQLDLFAYTAANPGALGLPFSNGSKIWLQGWFRDPPSPKTTMMSDALEVTFVP
jgi:hypothetical protein